MEKFNEAPYVNKVLQRNNGQEWIVHFQDENGKKVQIIDNNGH